MDNIQNLDSVRSIKTSRTYNDSALYDMDNEPVSNGKSSHRSSIHLSSRGYRAVDPDVLNSDEPARQVPIPSPLQDQLRSIDNSVGRGIRLPLAPSRTIHSVRIIPDSGESNRSYSSQSREDGRKGNHPRNGEPHLSARSYRPKDPTTVRPVNGASASERAYIWRQKFARLAMQNPRVEIPDTNDPDALERLYTEALRTHHYSTTSPTWMIYMGLGYAAFQFALSKLGFKLPAEFVYMQLEVMSHYPQLMKALGDPGGPSIGSSWPPWLKLTFVIAVQTTIFVIVYKISGNNALQANNVQKFIASTGLMGGKTKGDEATVDQASTGLEGMLGGLGGILGGGGGALGGLGGLMKTVMGALGGGGAMANIDVDNPPPPVTDDEPIAPESGTGTSRVNSNRRSMFDV